MGTVLTIIVAWTAVSAVAVVVWSLLVDRHHVAFVVAEPRSHVAVLRREQLAPVIRLDEARRRRSA